MSTDTITRNAALHYAVSLLAGMCDGAVKQDGVGFNSLDAKFGRRIAGIMPEHWTDEIATDASAILPIYRRQLAGYGVNVDELPLVEGAARNHVARDQARAAERKTTRGPYAIVKDDEIRVFQSFNIKDDLKTAGYRWSQWDKAWVAKLGKDAAQKVLDLGVDLRDGAEQIREAAAAEAKPVVPGRVMYDAKSDLIIIETAHAGVVPLDEMRALPGRKWDGTNQVNTCFPVPEVLDIAVRCGLEVTQVARDAIEARAVRMAESSAVETEFTTGTPLDKVLRPYQMAGVAYMTKHRGAINADDMGLGKTLQAIAAFEAGGEFPVLVTCPASLRGNWIKEISRWVPHRTAAISDGHIIPDTDYVIVSYEGSVSLAREAGMIQ